jgi:hypothetical protein
MSTPPNTVTSVTPPQRGSMRVTDDVVYQLVTVGAILLVLSTVWIF